MTAALVVAILAGGAAAVLRYALALAFARRDRLIWAVFTVNVVGSALGGSVIALAEAGLAGPELRLILLSGVAGALTTFSTWTVEAVQLVQAGRWRTAAATVGLGLAVGLAAAVGGWMLVSLLL